MGLSLTPKPSQLTTTDSLVNNAFAVLAKRPNDESVRLLQSAIVKNLVSLQRICNAVVEEDSQWPRN
jgi:hypothetical protein